MKAILLIAHGNRDGRTWPAIDDFAMQMKWFASKTREQYLIRTAYLSQAPFIEDQLDEFKACGIRDVYIVPLFIGFSKHVDVDIPKKLANYDLSYHIANPFLDTLCIDKIIEDKLLQRSNSSAFLFLVHGSKKNSGTLSKRIDELGHRIGKHIGISYLTSMFIGIGQGLNERLPEIKQLAQQHSDLVVLPLYTASDLKRIKHIFQMFQQKHPQLNIDLIDTSILPDCRLAEEYFKNIHKEA